MHNHLIKVSNDIKITDNTKSQLLNSNNSNKLKIIPDYKSKKNSSLY